METTDALKTREELIAVAAELRKTLEAGLSKSHDSLERPYPVALMLEQKNPDKMDLCGYEFDSLCDAYTGLRASHWIEPYLQLHVDLIASNPSQNSRGFKFGCDCEVRAVADKILPPKNPDARDLLWEEEMGISRKDFTHQEIQQMKEFEQRLAKAIVLKTQSRSFLIILNKAYNHWSLHMREFWPDIRDAMKRNDYGLEKMFDIQAGKAMALEDVIELSRRIDQYSDDLPGVDRNRLLRPSLETFLGGSLMAGENDAGHGLRYGDSRDYGYLLSLKHSNDALPEVSHSLHANLRDIDYVASVMSSAIEGLREDTEENQSEGQMQLQPQP